MTKIVTMIGWVVIKTCNTEGAYETGLSVLDLPYYEETCESGKPHVAVGQVIEQMHPASVVIHDISGIRDLYEKFTPLVQEKAAKLHKNSQLHKILREAPKIFTFILE